MRQTKPVSDELRRSPIATGRRVVISFEHARLEIALTKAMNDFIADQTEETFEAFKKAREDLIAAGGQPWLSTMLR